ncbi:MAG: DNA repair protein RadC [Saprospiraceae bacterium]|nr:DNA repair protein RadC [Saprospiraceae bacterium]
MKKQKSTGIKSWSDVDQPREKLLIKGRESLSDAELLAILIGSGNKEMTAVGLAQKILKSVSNNLHELGRKELSELMAFKGIGEAKSITITAALEIGRRRQLIDPIHKPIIRSSRDAYNLIAPMLVDINHEEFWILLMNHGGKLIKRLKVSSGGVSQTLVDPKIIFKKALDCLASKIILVHNHPSGSLKPSKSDIGITQKLQRGGKLLDVRVDDHIIISENGYFSFADEDMMEII